MPDEPKTPQPAKKPRARPGEVDKHVLDDIQLADDVSTAAHNTDHAAIFVKEVKQADVTALDAKLKVIDDTLVPDVINKKKAALAPTQLEEKLRADLVEGCRVIQRDAGRTFPGDHAKREAYLIGKENFGRNRETLNAESTAIIALARTDMPKGVDTAQLDALDLVRQNWVKADKAQKTAEDAAGKAVQALRTAVAELNLTRRDIQIGAGNTFSHTEKANAPQRRAFGLQADRPMNP